MRSPRRAAALPAAVAVLLACAVEPAAGQGVGAVLSGKRLSLPGCSIAPPEGPGWVEVRPGPWNVMFGRKHAAPGRTSVAQVAVVNVDEPIATMDELVRQTRLGTVAREQEGRKVEFTLLEVEPDSTIAPLAVRYRYAFEDRKAPGMKGKVLVCTGRGVRAVHPDAPLFIDYQFSERALKDTPLGETDTQARFLAGFRFTRPDVPLESTAPIERWIHEMEHGADAIWLCRQREDGSSGSPDELIRLDPATLAITGRVAVAKGPADAVVADDGVWVGHHDGTVMRVDPSAMRATATVRCGKSASRIAIHGGSAWVTDVEKGGLWRIDRATAVATRIRVNELKWSLAIVARESLLWVSNGVNEVVVLDAATGQPSGPSVGVGGDPVHMAWAADALWVLCHRTHSVQRVDPVTRRVVATIPLPGVSPGLLLVHDGAVWVTDQLDGTLIRIDPATNAIAGAPMRPGLSFTLASAADGLWICDTLGQRLGRLPAP